PSELCSGVGTRPRGPSAFNYCEAEPPGSNAVCSRLCNGLRAVGLAPGPPETRRGWGRHTLRLAARGPLEQGYEVIGQSLAVEIARHGVVRGERERQPPIGMVDEPPERVGERVDIA